MIILDTSLRKLQIFLAGAVTTNELQWSVMGKAVLQEEETRGKAFLGLTNGATAVDMVPVPDTQNTKRYEISQITVYNADTVAATVTVAIDDNGTDTIIWAGSVATLKTLLISDDMDIKIAP